MLNWPRKPDAQTKALPIVASNCFGNYIRVGTSDLDFLFSGMDEFLPDTIVRTKHSGRFAKIISRCYCGNGKSPIHYELLIEDDTDKGFHTIVMNHSDLELECEPVK